MFNFLINHLFYSTIFIPIVYCPGPMTMYSLSNGIQLGPVKSLIGIIGGTFAYIILMSISFYAVKIIQQFSLIFLFFRYSGAIYLIYLSYKFISSRTLLLNQKKNIQLKSSAELFFGGFLIAITNPKAILVYISIFPTFLEPGRPIIVEYMCVCFLFLSFQFTSAFSYALFGRKLFQWVQHNNREKLFCIIIGVALITVAIFLFFYKN